MYLSLSDYITPSGFSSTLSQACYNHFNPSGLLYVGIEAEIQKGLAELKELM
jgi:hypothetical protein